MRAALLPRRSEREQLLAEHLSNRFDLSSDWGFAARSLLDDGELRRVPGPKRRARVGRKFVPSDLRCERCLNLYVPSKWRGSTDQFCSIECRAEAIRNGNVAQERRAIEAAARSLRESTWPLLDRDVSLDQVVHDAINELAWQGFGYGRIASTLGISEDDVAKSVRGGWIDHSTAKQAYVVLITK